MKSKISVWSFPYEKPLSSIIEMLITKAKKPSNYFLITSIRSPQTHGLELFVTIARYR